MSKSLEIVLSGATLFLAMWIENPHLVHIIAHGIYIAVLAAVRMLGIIAAHWFLYSSVLALAYGIDRWYAAQQALAREWPSRDSAWGSDSGTSENAGSEGRRGSGSSWHQARARAWKKTERELRYAMLGLEPDAPNEAVKAAYRRMAKDLHPDTTGSRDRTLFQNLNEAYQEIKKERGMS